MAKEIKKTFAFRIVYFKPYGKFYTEVMSDIEVGVVGSGSPYMDDVVSKIRGWRDSDDLGALPGLSGAGWDGPILIDCEEGYPCLLMPGK